MLLMVNIIIDCVVLWDEFNCIWVDGVVYDCEE